MQRCREHVHLEEAGGGWPIVGVLSAFVRQNLTPLCSVILAGGDAWTVMSKHM